MNKTEQKYSTGAIESIKDNRTIQYSALPQAQEIVAIPAKYETNISKLPVQNQGPIGACVAYSIALMIQYKEWKESGIVRPMSQRFIYTIARAISGWNGNAGQGLMPLFGFKAVANGTWDSQALDDTSLPHSLYEKMTITEAMKADGYKYRIGGFAQPTDLVSLQKAVMNEGLVAISMPYGGGNFNQGELLPYTITESRHYIVVKGWKTIDRRIKILFRNHWTDRWGNNGEGEFYWDEYQGQVIDMFTIADVPDSFIETARATAFQFNVDIPKGSNGPLVTELQKALTDLGYYMGPVTGFFGDMTAQAVTRFQQSQKIPTNNGKNVGPATRAKLNELLSLVKKKSTSLNLSDAGKALIKAFEGLHDADRKTAILEPQKDPIGLYTLGWGARYDKNGNEVTSKTPPITMAEADGLFDRDVKRFVATVNQQVGGCVNQNQFDALVSFCYNEGNLWDLPAKVKAGTVTQQDFERYCMAGGKPILLTRRTKEWRYYQTGKTTG